jgi:ankyrin repeat protein
MWLHVTTVCADAAMNGRDESLLALLDTVAHDADARARMVDAHDKQGRTPALYACLNGHRESLRQLLLHGADLTLRDADGETALHKVASHGSIAQVRLVHTHTHTYTYIQSQLLSR